VTVTLGDNKKNRGFGSL